MLRRGWFAAHHHYHYSLVSIQFIKSCSCINDSDVFFLFFLKCRKSSAKWSFLSTPNSCWLLLTLLLIILWNVIADFLLRQVLVRTCRIWMQSFYFIHFNQALLLFFSLIHFMKCYKILYIYFKIYDYESLSFDLIIPTFVWYHFRFKSHFFPGCKWF